MLWLDGLLAVPSLGIRTRPAYKLVSDFQRSLAAFIDYFSSQFPDIEVQTLDIWGYSLTAKKTGLTFKISPKNILGQNAYAILQEPTPGGLPRIELPEIRSYSELLTELSTHLKKVLELFRDLHGFQYDRIGIVADAVLDTHSIPPGLSSWISELAKPLGGDLVSSTANLVAKLSETDQYRDQCHHAIKFDQETPETGFDFKLDWQRVFKEKVPLEYKPILTTMDECIENALKYFERFGEGGAADG